MICVHRENWKCLRAPSCYMAPQGSKLRVKSPTTKKPMKSINISYIKASNIHRTLKEWLITCRYFSSPLSQELCCELSCVLEREIESILMLLCSYCQLQENLSSFPHLLHCAPIPIGFPRQNNDQRSSMGNTEMARAAMSTTFTDHHRKLYIFFLCSNHL